MEGEENVGRLPYTYFNVRRPLHFELPEAGARDLPGLEPLEISGPGTQRLQQLVAWLPSAIAQPGRLSEAGLLTSPEDISEPVFRVLW